jgi:3',5'-cyclic AMP phosphodiesterase CpdA
MATFRFLHITDLHISIPPENDELGSTTLWMSMQHVFPSRAREPLLRAVAALAFHLRKTIDTIVLSGDLADDGEIRNLEAARSFVDEPAIDGTYETADEFPTLYNPEGNEASTFLLPGNHDRFKGVGRLPGGDTFDEVFYPRHWRKGIGGVQSLKLEKSDEALFLIAADFCLKGSAEAPFRLWGQGSAEGGTLGELVAKTAKIKNEKSGAAIIWVLHFPPLLDVEQQLLLRSSRKVIEAARSQNVRYIIAGHLHRDQTNNYHGVDVICTGSASSDMHEAYGNTIQLFEVEVTGSHMSLSRQLYRYRAVDGAFSQS